MNYIVVALPILIVGIVCFVVYLMKLVYLDALVRDIQRPKLWTFIALGSNNGSGLLLYLIHRRKYPMKRELTDMESYQYKHYKKCIYVGLTFVVIGAVGMVLCGMYQ